MICHNLGHSNLSMCHSCNVLSNLFFEEIVNMKVCTNRFKNSGSVQIFKYKDRIRNFIKLQLSFQFFSLIYFIHW